MANFPIHKETLLILGCGDLGRRLAGRLGGESYDILGLRRTPQPNTSPLCYQTCDLTDGAQLSSILAKGANVIVITMTPGERSDSAYRRAYVDVSRNLVESLQRLRLQPRLILFVSSTAVYAQNLGEWIDEASPARPESESAKRLLEAEQLLHDSGFPICILRSSGIYGPGRYRLIEQVVNRRASASKAFTNRIHADDCAAAIAHLIELQKSRPLDPVYLASDCEPTPMEEVVNWIAAQLQLENIFAADAHNERGNKRISNQRLLSTGFKFRYKDFRAGYSEVIQNWRNQSAE